MKEDQRKNPASAWKVKGGWNNYEKRKKSSTVRTVERKN